MSSLHSYNKYEIHSLPSMFLMLNLKRLLDKTNVYQSNLDQNTWLSDPKDGAAKARCVVVAMESRNRTEQARIAS